MPRLARFDVTCESSALFRRLSSCQRFWPYSRTRIGGTSGDESERLRNLARELAVFHVNRHASIFLLHERIKRCSLHRGD